jgi:hypothetical protein
MFKIRQVYNEKIQEFESASQPLSSEETEEKSTSELNTTSTEVRPQLVQSSARGSSSTSMGSSMRPSNFEDGYKSDQY